MTTFRAIREQHSIPADWRFKGIDQIMTWANSLKTFDNEPVAWRLAAIMFAEVIHQTDAIRQDKLRRHPEPEELIALDYSNMRQFLENWLGIDGMIARDYLGLAMERNAYLVQTGQETDGILRAHEMEESPFMMFTYQHTTLYIIS